MASHPPLDSAPPAEPPGGVHPSFVVQPLNLGMLGMSGAIRVVIRVPPHSPASVDGHVIVNLDETGVTEAPRSIEPNHTLATDN
jgi:hypothetical protein